MYTPGLIRYTRYFDEMWSDQEYIPSNSLFDFPLGITSDSSSGIWVAGASSWFGYQAVGYIRYYNGAWGEPQIITDTTEAIEHEGGAITTDALGRVWIGWLEVDIDLENDSIFFNVKAKRWESDDWSEDILIVTRSMYDFFRGPNLTPDNEGGMWALWWHAPKDGACVFLETRHWDGEEWLQVDTIAAGGKFGVCFPEGEIAVDAEGNAWAVWRQAVEPDDTYGDIYYSVNQGEGWSTPAPVCEHPAFDINPEIAVDGEGRIWCVWSSVRDSQYQVYASYATGVGVTEPVTPPATHHLPSLTIDKSVGREFTFRVSSPDVREELLIYDAGGRVVKRLAVNSGRTIRWDGTDMEGVRCASGVYFVKLEHDSFTVTQRVVLIK